MNRLIALALALTSFALTGRADAHGTPIHVTGTSALSASGGVADTLGYATMLFYDTTEEGDPFATLTLPNVGPVVIWQVPGYEISGLNPASSFSIEVLARPINNVLPVQQRVLWYWNSTTGQVATTASPLYLLGTGQRFTTIDPALSTPPAPFLLADPIGGLQAEGGQQGFHNHGLLSYALDNSPIAPNGAYGFFARLISNQYSPSDPFLVVLNRGVAYERMAEAAAAINAAAFLPGDFNHDDRVDAADYVTWRNDSGTAQDYQLWRGAFGATVSGIGSSSGIADAHGHVPEPESLLLAITCGIALNRYRRQRQPSSSRC